MFAVVYESIDVAALACSVRSDECGAVVTFEGTVRKLSEDGKDVTGLSYEAHDAMAVSQFQQIAAEARERFGMCTVAIVHRAGDLAIGEVSVAIAVAAPHRSAAFDACEYAIDELKRRAPIWKKEHYVAGESIWKTNPDSLLR